MQDSDRPRSATDRRAPALGGTVSQLRIARIPRVPEPPALVEKAALIEKTAPGAKPAARIDSRTLFRGSSREVVIAHDGTDYRLRLTASGKLILTK